MADAPAVSYPVGRTPLLAALLALLWLAGLLPALAIARQPGALGTLVVGLGLLAAGAALWSFWRGQRARRLRWDGACWSLDESAAGSPFEQARVEVHLDLQRLLLLSYRDPRQPRRRWLWAQASSDPWRWHLLRCALYSSAKSVAPTAPGAEAERA